MPTENIILKKLESLHTRLRYGTPGRRFVGITRGSSQDGGQRRFAYKGQPFHFRNTNVDLTVIHEVLFEECYLGRVPQWGCLLGHYDNLVSTGIKPLIIDCGAHIGSASRWYAEAFPKARIVSLEPEPSNFATLSTNVADLTASEDGEIIPLNVCLAECDGSIDLFDRDQGSWAFSTRPSNKDDTPINHIESRSLDSILLEEGVECEPLILKIDIEGAEGDIDFQKLAPLLDRFSLIAIELHDWMFPWQGTSSSFLKYAAQADSDLIYQGENVFLYSRKLKGIHR